MFGEVIFDGVLFNEDSLLFTYHHIDIIDIKKKRIVAELLEGHRDLVLLLIRNGLRITREINDYINDNCSLSESEEEWLSSICKGDV